MKTFCSYYNKGTCRSCDLITHEYADQISQKEKLLKESLKEFPSAVFLTSVRSPAVQFRNKAKFVVTGSVADPVIGLWGEKDLDVGRELLACGLHLEEINRLLPRLKSFIKESKIPPYQIAERRGELKGIILFHSEGSDQTYLRFILRSKESVDRIKKNLQALAEDFPSLTCVSVNIQPVPHAVLEGEEEIFLTEMDHIDHRLGGMSFSLGPRAFVQTNQKVAHELYSTAANWIKESGLKRFMELFAGQGPFSFFAAPHIEQGLGIEINEAAVGVANETAMKYGFGHLKFKSADAGKVSSEIEEFSPDILLTNPPRRGLSEAVALILNQRPKLLVYSSCNHESLRKDLLELRASYDVARVQIFDMFPHTTHFETLVELKRR